MVILVQLHLAEFSSAALPCNMKMTLTSNKGCRALGGIVKIGVKSCNNTCSIDVAPSGIAKGVIKLWNSESTCVDISFYVRSWAI
jgi:hypothetical protein